MKKGDPVLTDHPERKSRKFVRTYGIVHEITTGKDIIIELADGSLIRRSPNSVAVYIRQPSNWQELYEKQQVVFSQARQHSMPRKSRTTGHHH